MLSLAIGCLGFVSLFGSDGNDLRLHRKSLRFLFPLGIVLLFAASVVGCVFGTSPLENIAWRILFGVFGFVFLVLLVYSLFFALPVGSSYAKPGEKRSAVTTGVYALCRHPGVLFFVPLMLCLWLSLGLPLLCVVVWSVWNILLAWFEDAVVFPQLLEGYNEYKRTTPFLIPGRPRRGVQ